MPPRKTLDDMTALTEAQQADIDINEVRFQEHEATLESVLNTLKKIGGEDQIVELLALGEIQLKVARREEAVDSIRTEAGKSWDVLKRALQVDRNGKVTLYFHSLEEVVQALGESRMQMLNSLGRLGGTRYMGPREVAEALRRPPSLTALPERTEKPFDPKREKETYQAMTVGQRTEAGKRAIEVTRGRAQKAVDAIASDSLVRSIVYYQMTLASLLRVHAMAKSTRDETVAIYQSVEAGGSNESIEELFKMFDYDLSSEKVIELAGQLIQRIEFVLKMLEQETGVDNILTKLTPGRQLALLKKKIEKEMPAGPDKDCAMGVIDRALLRRQNAGLEQKKLPEALQTKLRGIGLLEMRGEETENEK